MKKIIASVLCIAIIASSLAIMVFAGNDLPFIPIASNKCGANVKYKLNETTGVLTLEGSGDMYNYGDGSYSPWYGKRILVKSVEVEKGITSIGNFVFADCENLEYIVIPISVTQIGDDTFDGCEDFMVRGYSGSFAEEYALENGIPFECITVCGDADCNGEVTIRDAATILQHIAGWDVIIDTVAADVVGNDGVTIRDAAVILQYIAGWDVVLGG